MVVRKIQAPVVGLDACVSRCEVPTTVSLDTIREQLPDPSSCGETAGLFRLLGDPTRVAVLHALLVGGELCVCDIANVVGVGENIVSQAMRLLRAADVVRTRRDGRRIHYRLADAHVRMLLDLSADHVGHSTTMSRRTTTPRGDTPANWSSGIQLENSQQRPALQRQRQRQGQEQEQRGVRLD